ncbi:hypothetical protein FDZ73_22025, partial [bacterium]
LSWYVKTQGITSQNSTGGATATVRWFDGSQTPLGVSSNLAPTTGTQDWQRKGARVDAPAGAVFARIELSANDSGTAWFDNVQFEYGSVINQSNLLYNESFEENRDANIDIPDRWNAGTLNTAAGDGVDASVYHTGINSVLINGQSAVNKNFFYEIKMSGDAGTPINFSGWSKAQNIAATGGYYQVLLRIDYTDGTNGWYGANFNTGIHDWEYTERIVAAAKGFKGLAVYGKLDSKTGQAWFDDFRVRLDGSPNALLSAYNLLQNGSFERADTDSNITWSGGADEWKIFNGSATNITWVNSNGALAAYNGAKMVQIANPTAMSLVGNVPLEPIKPGTTYTASAVIKTENVTGSGAVLKIDVFDANDVYKGHKLSKVITGTNDWTRVTVSLTESEARAIDVSAAKVRATVGTLGSSGGVMYFDAVRMSEGGVETTYSYTADGNYITTITNPLGNQISLTNDSRGNVTRATDPLNNSTNLSYDALDRLTAAENAAGLR